MNRGRYDEATKLLNRGCYFAGVGTRRGGQMQLWLGQALSAAGRRGEALKLMDALKAHPDRDVRKVAKELLFIMKAPPLQLGEESRVSFDMDEFDAEKSYERAPDGTIRRRDAAAFEKPPEHFCRVDIPRRRVAAPPRPRRGHSAETGARTPGTAPWSGYFNSRG